MAEYLPMQWNRSPIIDDLAWFGMIVDKVISIARITKYQVKKYMYHLYLDDSGKFDPNNTSTQYVCIGGFVVHSDQWHKLVSCVSGAKAAYRSDIGPHDWEIKSNDFLSARNFKRANKKKLCFEIAEILKRHQCLVFASIADKSKARMPKSGGSYDANYVPLAVQRLLPALCRLAKDNNDQAAVVCDWSTHWLDSHMTHCVTSQVISQGMNELVGGVMYASSRALIPIQISDLIASCVRRHCEGQGHIEKLFTAFSSLRYVPGMWDERGYEIKSIQNIF